MAKTKPDLALYIHWPYCARICPYCDFNVYKNRKDDGLVSDILKDMGHWRSLSGPRRLTSIHFGGGTPSLMTPGDIQKIITLARSLWSEASDLEVAIEINPNDATRDKLRDFHSAGINRISLGIQSFQDKALTFLGRDHDGRSALRALNLAISIFPSVSTDLIFGWHGQRLVDWLEDLSGVIALGVHHISAYQLTIEQGTAFAKAQERGKELIVKDKTSAGLYEFTSQTLTESGYEHYEISNFAMPGHRSKHNLAYWKGIDYAGVGPGAHGRLTTDGQRIATVAAMQPKDYRQKIVDNGNAVSFIEILSDEDWGDEYALMGLRISDGISLSRFADISGRKLDTDIISQFVQDGYLNLEGDTLSASEKGRTVLNYITEKLLV